MSGDSDCWLCHYRKVEPSFTEESDFVYVLLGSTNVRVLAQHCVQSSVNLLKGSRGQRA